MKPPTLETETAPVRLEVDRSLQAEASSAHSRLNIPLNLTNWRALPEDIQAILLWFHQHALDRGLTLDDCSQAIGYDKSTIFRVLKGIYEGNWKNIADAIRSYRKLSETRGTIQTAEFAANSMTRLICAGLDYALANKSITTIIGESRMGKSVTGRFWQSENNHGRSVLITAPAYGGTKALLREIAGALGINKNLAALQMHEAIMRAFNPNRILIVDEAHRLLPGDRRCNPTNLEILRDVHDRAGDPKDPFEKRGCALALLATARFDTELRKGEYQFEQLIGRIGMPIRLPRTIKNTDLTPIIGQYVTRPTAALLEACNDIANKPGRLGILVETLKVASRMARKKSEKLGEAHVFKAIKLREQMQSVLEDKPEPEAK